MTQNDGDGDRHDQISREQPEHASKRELDSLLRRLLVEAQAQFGVMATVLDRPYDEVNAVAALPEAQIRGTRRLDFRRSIEAADTATPLVELRVAGPAVGDREVEQVLDPRLRVQCHPDLEFVGEHPRKGPGMLDEQVLVALPNHVTHAEIERR